MGSLDPVYFNCGEYRPGQEPITIPVLKPPAGSVYIPTYSEYQFPRFPEYPEIPPVSTPFDRPLRRPVIDPPTGGGGGGSGSGTASSIVVGQVRFPDPPTTGFPERYRCTDVKFYCPEDLSLPEEQRRVLKIKRFCVLCTPQTDPELGGLVWPPGCVYNSKQQCEQSCQDSNTPNNCVSVSPAQVFNEVSIETGQVELQIQTNQQVNNVNLTYGSLIQTNQQTSVIQLGEIVNTTQYNVTVSGETGQPVLYNAELNFFRSKPSVSTTLVVNSKYPSIFAEMVPVEIDYLINRENSIAEWSEFAVNDLTLPKVAIGLNKELLDSFKAIHYPGNTAINLNYFLEMVRKHILTGTLSELDPQYFKELAKKHKEDKKIVYTGTNVREYLERAALGVISVGAITADTSDLNSVQLRQLRRQRRLNEDVLARIPVCPIDYENNPLYLGNAGICLTKAETSDTAYLNIGDGDGYYIQSDTVRRGCIPFVTNNHVSSAYYVPVDVRLNALTIMGEDYHTVLRAESTAESNEFSTGGLDDAGSLQLEPLYFALELSSVSSVLTSNPLVDRTVATYRLLRDQELIDKHTDNNGFAVSRINIDYRDPIYRYSRDTSAFNLEQNDITFRAFEDNKGLVNQAVLTRTIPFGVILTPVAGSKFNPFNGASKIERFDSSVSRSLRLVPDINTDSIIERNHLQQINLMDVSGQTRLGVYEPNDGQNITYRFYASSDNLLNSFYSAGIYTTSTSLPSSTGASYLVTNVIDTIIENHDPKSITWFDVIRRIPINKFGELLYDGNEYLYQKLGSGFRNNMKIRHALSRLDESIHTLLDDDDAVIITRENRKNAKNYQTRR